MTLYRLLGRTLSRARFHCQRRLSSSEPAFGCCRSSFLVLV